MQEKNQPMSPQSWPTDPQVIVDQLLIQAHILAAQAPTPAAQSDDRVIRDLSPLGR